MLYNYYGLFVYDEEHVYINGGNFCYYQITPKCSLKIITFGFNFENEVVRSEKTIQSESEYKPLFFRYGEARLG